MPWKRIVVWTSALVLFFGVTVGVLFAGSSDEIAAGVTVAGVDVSGMSQSEAAAFLAEKYESVASKPLVVTVAGKSFEIAPADVEAEVDWNRFAAEAQDEGAWPMPFRGIKRLVVRLKGADVDPAAEVYEPALAAKLDAIAKGYDRPGRNAAIELTGSTRCSSMRARAVR